MNGVTKKPAQKTVAKPKPKVIAKAKAAAKTNTKKNSLVKCEVTVDRGEWISPGTCQTFYIDDEAKFPEIIFEIKTNETGPYDWSWEIKWGVMACPQAKNKTRFSPKHAKTFSEKGAFTSDQKQWKVDLGKTLGGDLTVTVKAGATTFVRKVKILGKSPTEAKINMEVDSYSTAYPTETKIAKKIFKQESRYNHFYTDEMPLVSFDNGYGLGQATFPEPTYEQVWDWKRHTKYIVTSVVAGKRAQAKRYLDKHGNYTDEHLEAETLVFYNGANHHYYVWDTKTSAWIANPNVLCDPAQSNSGWDMSKASNADKNLEELRAGKGTKVIYTGKCYAEHVQSN